MAQTTDALGDNPRRIAYVDGLRGVAVLAVVAHHAAKYWLVPHSMAARHGFMEGSHGVDLFFIVSGFCLTYPTLARLAVENRGRFDVARYFARRVVRIMPPYVAAVLACVVLATVVRAAGYTLPAGAMSAPSSLDTAKQLLFLDRDPHFVNGSFWTLGIEWRWYFAMPVLLWVWTKSPRLFALVAAAAFVLYHATALRAIDVGVLPAFMLGIVAADVAAFERRNAFVRFALPFCLIAIAAGVALEPKSSTEFYVQDQLAWQLAAFFFVVAAGSLAPLRTMLSWLPIAVVGLASYSIYLVHEPIVALVQQTTPYGPLMAASIALLAGALFFMLFERPFLREPLRGRAIAFFSVPFERLCRWCGFESSRLTLWVKQLADTTAPPPAVAPVPLPAVVAPANATATEAAP